MWAVTFKYLLMTIIGLAIVVSLLLLLVCAFILKGKHDLGVGFETQCTNYYYERERGDFLASEEYEKIVRLLFFITIILLSACYLLVTIISIFMIIIYTYLNWSDIGYGGAVEYNFFGKIKQNPRILIFTLFIIGIVLGGLITCFILWIYSIIYYKTYANSKIKFSVSPFAKGTTPSVFIRNQLIFIIVTLLTALFLHLTMFNSNENVKGISSVIVITLLIVLVLLPFISYYIHKFDNSIQTYLTKLKDDTNFKLTYLDELLLKSRESDFYKYNPPNNLLESSDVKYKEMYLMHISRDYSLRDIVIPESVKSYLLYVYSSTNDEYLIKQKFAGFYNARHEEIKDRSINLNYDVNSLFESDNFNKIKVFLNMHKVNNNKSDFVNIINRDILQNPSFDLSKRINPLTIADQEALEKLRNDKTIENTIGSYYNRSKIIVYTISFLALYIVYHGLYGVLQEKHLQTWAMILVILIIAVLIVGFVLMKSQWL